MRYRPPKIGTAARKNGLFYERIGCLRSPPFARTIAHRDERVSTK